jgi:hypothetical protein
MGDRCCGNLLVLWSDGRKVDQETFLTSKRSALIGSGLTFFQSAVTAETALTKQANDGEWTLGEHDELLLEINQGEGAIAGDKLISLNRLTLAFLRSDANGGTWSVTVADTS